MNPNDETGDFPSEDPYDGGSSEYTDSDSDSASDSDSDSDVSEEELLRLKAGLQLSTREIPMGMRFGPTELSDWGTEQGLCSGDMGDCNTLVVAWDWRSGHTPAGESYGYYRYMLGAHGAGGMGNVDFIALYAGVPVGVAQTYVLKAPDTVGAVSDHLAFLEGAEQVGLDPSTVFLARGLGSCYTVLRDGTVHVGRVDGREYTGDRGITDSLTLGYLEP
ncbi:hypothetical protein [Streptomyces sp. NPDC051014]|uniref:hypothetical protein n=1 Tax=Streptomyces sp. NPDC051014 TaxID=3155751 RepID=UPI003411C76B